MEQSHEQPALTRARSLRGCRLANLTDRELELWLDACARMEHCVRSLRRVARGSAPARQLAKNRRSGVSVTLASIRLPHNYPLHLTSAMFKEAIAFTPL